MGTKRERPTVSALLKVTVHYEAYVKIAQVSATVILPVVTGVLAKLCLDVKDDNVFRKLVGVVIALAVMQIILAIVFGLIPSTSPTSCKALVEQIEMNEALIDQADTLESQRNTNIAALIAISQALTAVNNVLAFFRAGDGTCDRNNDFKIILEPLVALREEAFKFYDHRLLYNFAVYMFNPTAKDLEPVWRAHHPKLIVTGLGRKWKPGEGHVGIAFSQRHILVADDLTKTGVFQTTVPTDKLQYRSAVSIPIYRGADIAGIFVCSSNAPGQFGCYDEDKVFRYDEFEWFFAAIGELLSVYLTYTDGVGEFHA